METKKMFRLLFLCRIFDKYHDRRGGSLQYYDDFVDKNVFINHLLNEKYFAEDIREMLKRLIYCLTGLWVLQGGKGLHRMQKHRRMVYDFIEEAKRRGYLIENTDCHGNQKLKMDNSGRRFIELLNFIQVFGKEHGFIISISIAVIGTGIIGTLFAHWSNIFQSWTTFLSKIVQNFL